MGANVKWGLEFHGDFFVLAAASAEEENKGIAGLLVVVKGDGQSD